MTKSKKAKNVPTKSFFPFNPQTRRQIWPLEKKRKKGKSMKRVFGLQWLVFLFSIVKVNVRNVCVIKLSFV